MFLGFDLEIDDFERFKIYNDVMKNEMKQLDTRCSNFLQKYKNKKDTSADTDVLDASKIMTEWFPEYENAQVFISYSSANCIDAQNIAGFLKKEFGLNVFIDSLFWRHCNELLRAIDNRYCWDKQSELYDYNLRNFSTSHIHNMVCASLMRMLDQCECVIFLHTNQSITSELTPNNIIQHTSFSPWIYYELETINYIQKKIPFRYDKTLKRDFEANTNLSEQVKIQYPVKLNELNKISSANLFEWKEKYKECATTGELLPEKALKLLYENYASNYKTLIEYYNKG